MEKHLDIFDARVLQERAQRGSEVLLAGEKSLILMTLQRLNAAHSEVSEWVRTYVPFMDKKYDANKVIRYEYESVVDPIKLKFDTLVDSLAEAVENGLAVEGDYTAGEAADALRETKRGFEDEADRAKALEEALSLVEAAGAIYNAAARKQGAAQQTGKKESRHRPPKRKIPKNCFQTQALFAAAVPTTTKNVSLWVNGKGNPPKDFCWPFQIRDTTRLQKVREELKRRGAERRVMKELRENGLDPQRKKTKESYSETWKKHQEKSEA